jgi:hypothetical protein
MKPTPDSIVRALYVHKANGLIRDWRYNRAASWPKGGPKRPFSLFIEPMGDGPTIEVRNLREAGLFCNALASAHQAILRHERSWWPNNRDAAYQPTDRAMLEAHGMDPADVEETLAQSAMAADREQAENLDNDNGAAYDAEGNQVNSYRPPGFYSRGKREPIDGYDG